MALRLSSVRDLDQVLRYRSGDWLASVGLEVTEPRARVDLKADATILGTQFQVYAGERQSQPSSELHTPLRHVVRETEGLELSGLAHLFVCVAIVGRLGDYPRREHARPNDMNPNVLPLDEFLKLHGAPANEVDSLCVVLVEGPNDR